MVRGDRDLESICAIATPLGIGGISVIRLSGPQSLSIIQKIAPFLPSAPESHRVYYGNLISHSVETAGEILDEVLISFFKAGRSFTGENTFEISCHGSPQICRRILKELVLSGARIADRGEFTYRAFMVGRLDLVQAESILALIQSQSDLSAKQALRQLSGELSGALIEIEDELIWCLAHIEASIDFSTEDIEIVTNDELRTRFLNVKAHLEKLLGTYKQGRLLKDGVRLVLAGEPNVGKSSLLNLLVEEDRAIVTETPGTTRDTIEAGFLVDGIKVVVTDTAGLRQTDDKVEQKGIARSYKAVEDADRIFFVYDSSKNLNAGEMAELEKLETNRLYIVGNKQDLAQKPIENTLKTLVSELKTLKNFQKIDDFSHFIETRVHFVSAWDTSSSQLLKNALAKDFEVNKIEDGALISQARHFENLSRAMENMERSAILLDKGMSSEFLALEMKESLLAVQETLGKRFDDQIMDRVFKEFCIGK